MKDEDELMIEIINAKTVFGLSNDVDNDYNEVLASTTNTEDCSLSNLDNNNGETREMGEEKQNNFTLNDLRTPISRSLKRKKVDFSMENDIEIVYEDDTSLTSDPLSQSAQSQQTNKTSPHASSHSSRRRPHSSIQTSASTLHDKYEKLVEKKIVNEDFLMQENKIRLAAFCKKHDLEIKSLELDIEIKKRQLDTIRKD